MKSYWKFLTAILAACFISATALAADASPSGTWKFTAAGRGGNPGVERTLILEVKEGKLTGTLKGANMGQFEIPDAAIEGGAIKAGVVSFTVTTNINDTKRVSKYEGKLEGDKITGSIEAPGRDGATQKRDWVATRAK